MGSLNLNEKKNSILGELDYLNSIIGLAKSFVKSRRFRKLLTDIQNDIFVIQTNIASPRNAVYIPQNITIDRVFSLQQETYFIESRLPVIKHFIIPEGATGPCLINCARAVVRQIERKIPGYLKKPTILAMYLDQVASLMFVLARKINKEGGFKERPPAYVVVSKRWLGRDSKEKERRS